MYDPIPVLKRAGFWKDRDANAGTIWFDGYSKLLCPKEFLNETAFNNFTDQVAAAKVRRHQTQLLRNQPVALQGKLFDVAKVEREEPAKKEEPEISDARRKEIAEAVNNRQIREQEPPQKQIWRNTWRNTWRKEDVERPFFKTFSELYQSRMKRREIMDRLRELGLKDPIRDEFVDDEETFTNRLLLLNKIRRRAGLAPLTRSHTHGIPKLPVEKAEKPKHKKTESAFVQIPDAVNSILLASGLTAEKKVAMALLWAEDASEELPEAILNVLTESAFTAELKVKMILALR